MSEYKKICAYCGKEFTTTSKRQKYCKDIHYDKCPVCGKEVIVKDLEHGPRACSRECSVKLQQQRCLEKYGETSYLRTDEGKAKVKATMQEKYGVDYAAQLPEVKAKMKQTSIERYGAACFLASPQGQQKVKENNLKRYGVEHTSKLEATQLKRRATTLKKYGEEELMATSYFKDKVKQTLLEHYGVENPMKSDIVKDKLKQVMQDKYGVDNIMHLPGINDRIKQTFQDKYGVDNPAHSPIIQAKIKSTLLERYGVDHPMKSKELVNRLIESNLRRYGVRSTLQCEDVKNRVAKTMQEKYGTSNYTQSNHYALSKFDSQADADKYIQFRADAKQFIQANYNDKPTATQLAKDLGVDATTVWNHLYKQDAADCIRKFVSTMEYEVIEYIKSLKDDINMIHNDRNVISPLEIDVYLPEFNFGIECNPSFTHNSSISDPWGAEPKHYLYHKEKSDKCREAGVELFHIFGWEWEYKQDIIKSMIKNRLGLTDRRIYARNTKVVEVDFKTSVNFLNENHLQGMLSAPIRLGLMDENDELVSLMTFGKMRSTIGQGQGNQYELSRFCNKLNTSVVGGASKLLKHYMKHYNTPLISFSDNAHTTGKLYENLNFKRDHDVAPRYTWVDPFTEYTINRLKTQKHNLRKLFNDDTIDIENKTEKEIMLEHGYVQVYDAGLTKWVLDN